MRVLLGVGGGSWGGSENERIREYDLEGRKGERKRGHSGKVVSLVCRIEDRLICYSNYLSTHL